MNWKKINLYILISFGISWLVALLMKLTYVEYGSLTSTIILGVLYMPGPALATFIIQKFIYKEGFKQYGWTFDKKKIKWLLFTPLIFIILFLLVFVVIALLGNTQLIPQFGQLDFSQEGFNTRFREVLSSKISLDKVKLPSLPAVPLFAAMLLEGVIAGVTLNLPFMFGEEFGWRGLMLRETQQMGFLKSNLFIGITWGLWHLPIILMGHNYPHHPHFGILLMCVFTTGLAPIFAYVRLKTKTIIGACMLHGMINATPAMFILYVANANELYSSIAGWAGVIACCIITACIYLFDRQFIRDYKTAE
jgi:membrane protease YdiL (CAAX protease family)